MHDAMRSSIDAFNKGGYTYNASSYIDEVFEGKVQEKIDVGSRYPGIWTLPICEVESSKQYKEANLGKETSLYWSRVDKNYPDKGKGQHGVQ